MANQKLKGIAYETSCESCVFVIIRVYIITTIIIIISIMYISVYSFYILHVI